MGKYKDEKGTTRVGDFLRSIGKSDLIKNVLENTGKLLPDSGVLGLLSKLLESDTELTEAQREHAIRLIELDMKDMEGVTKRWESDNASDSKLSKNVRPLTLIFLTVVTVIYIWMDSYFIDFNVDTQWIDLLKTLLLSVFIAYFGGRSYEKGKRL